jgi:hypothetical protein
VLTWIPPLPKIGGDNGLKWMNEKEKKRKKEKI